MDMTLFPDTASAKKKIYAEITAGQQRLALEGAGS
jgi:hypothetical protein